MRSVLLVGCLWLGSLWLGSVACQRSAAPPVEAIKGGRDVSGFSLSAIEGTRDGDRLDVRAVYSAGAEQISAQLRLRITPPARLESGTWAGFGSGGVVVERSVTFLGGQSAGPSLGGRFDLLDPSGEPVYRISIPLQELRGPR